MDDDSSEHPCLVRSVACVLEEHLTDLGKAPSVEGAAFRSRAP